MVARSPRRTTPAHGKYHRSQPFNVHFDSTTSVGPISDRNHQVRGSTRRQRLLRMGQLQWPTQSAIDRPLVAGSILFGVGWGLVGLCPGPAIANLATLSTPVIVFVVAMVLGTLAHDLWYARGAAGSEPSLAPANADG
jgi:uncharacterized membrane protein YedE/YeeE